MATKLAAKESEYDPICPHCEKKIDEVHWRQIEAVNAEYLFLCPTCKKVIGIGVRKAACPAEFLYGPCHGEPELLDNRVVQDDRETGPRIED